MAKSLRAARPPGGMSLVELLVVIAIISVLVALVLPAVQQSRESSRRAQCLDHLRQIGIALQSYHGALASFPTGCIERRIGANKTARQIGWGALLLPFLEQNELSNSLDLNTPFDSPRNAEFAATTLAIYLCPSVDRLAQQPATGRGPSDYGGIFGPRFPGDSNNPPQGMLVYDTPIRLSQVTDGTSNTLMVSEDSIYLPAGEWISGMTVFDVSYAINTAPKLDNDIHSEHPRGANGLFVDGSVRFLSQSMTTDVLSAICTRGTGEPTSNY